ncbi:MAG: triple tyrosine motif-containing protein, partial [Candidatus Sulfotelmatobacter sp.]
RDGDLWFAGYGGLHRYSSGVLSNYELPAPDVRAIHQDREGTLWIGALMEEHPGGLFRFRDGKLDQISGISDVNQIIDDRDGGLWVAGVRELIHMRGDKTTRYGEKDGLPERSVDIHQDSTGTLWIASYGGGLTRLRDGRLRTITTKDGLPNSMLAGMIEDSHGNLWVSSTQNIFCLSLKTLNDLADRKISSILPVSYGVAEGMRSSESDVGSPAGWETKDGRIWFPTMRGVVAIDPTAGNHLPPPVVIEEAWANKLGLAHSAQTSVPAGNNTFDFRFTAVSFSAPEKLRFKYRLEPFDKEWVDAGTRRSAHYTNMDPGRYSFHVLAVNNFGIWSDQEASVRFLLRPHFYQTDWFRTLCAACMLTLLWGGSELRVRQLAAQFKMRMEERENERTRIARDLHDTLLQSFQGLVFRFQAARYRLPERPEEASDALDTALVSADQAIAEGRDAIQQLRSGSSQESNLEEMLLAMGRELAASRNSGDSAPSLRVIVEGNRRAKRAMIRDEIYRIAREFLRNAYRHARARNIEAELRYDDDSFLLIVRDDGKGIDPKVLKDRGRAGHWGLPGMYERAEGMGARLDIWSEVGAGTELRLKVPAAIAYEKSGDRGRFKLFRKTRIYEHRS